MKLLTKLTSIFDRTNDLLAFFAVILLTFIMISVTYEIIIRQFLNLTILWMFEIKEYALIYITFLGAAWLLRREGHVKMDLLLNYLKPRTQEIFNIITSVVGAIICVVLVWYGIRVTWSSFQTGYYMPTILEAPRWPIVGIIPVGSFLHRHLHSSCLI